MNLIINARDAMEDGGTITVAATYDEGQELPLTLSVRDQGQGMSPQIIKQIFEPFFTTKETGKGTGLGLSVTYGLVQQNQGAIDVQSTVGVGTTMIVHLPADRMVVQESQVNQPGDVQILQGLTVMLVDDEDDLRLPMQAWLEDMGCQVIAVRDGDEALEQQDAFEGPIDFLVSDIQMPNLTGDALARLWRDIRPTSRIVLLSGFATEQAQVGSHLDGFLAKPVAFSDLQNMLAGLAAKNGRKYA